MSSLPPPQFNVVYGDEVAIARFNVVYGDEVVIARFNVVYRDEVVIARFQHCWGLGRGFLIPVMPLVIVSKIVCQRMFQLSDPSLPRTFVEDCSFSNERFSNLWFCQ